VIDHFITGLTGAHGIGANPGGPDPERSQPTDWSARSFPWHSAIPHQGGGDAA
jgi:hypothetical protein